MDHLALLQAEKLEPASTPTQPVEELQAMQEQKQAAEAECSRLQHDISDLKASLESEAEQRQCAHDELTSVRDHLSSQTAEMGIALQTVAALTAEVESAREQVQHLQTVLPAAQEDMERLRAEAESAQAQCREAVQQAQASGAAAEQLQQQQTELKEQLVSLQVCPAFVHRMIYFKQANTRVLGLYQINSLLGARQCWSSVKW